MARTLAVLVAVLIVVPTVEIAVILTVGRWIGAAPTVALLLAGALAGGWLLRREGRRAWLAFREAVRLRRPPAAEVAEGLLVVVGGLLMVLPGYLTDVLGLILLLPPTRRRGARLLLRRFTRGLPPEVTNALLGPLRVPARRGRGTPPVPAPPAPDAPARVVQGHLESGADHRGTEGDRDASGTGGRPSAGP